MLVFLSPIMEINRKLGQIIFGFDLYILLIISNVISNTSHSIKK